MQCYGVGDLKLWLFHCNFSHQGIELLWKLLGFTIFSERCTHQLQHHSDFHSGSG